MPVPTTLFKYLTSPAAIAVLDSGKLRWSSPLTFNDTGELRRMPRFDPAIDESYIKVGALLFEAASGRPVLYEARLAPLMKVVLDAARAVIQAGGNASGIIRDVPKRFKGADKKHEEMLRGIYGPELLGALRILCLSSEADSQRMWTEYGEDRGGCVLGLKVGDDQSPWSEAREVVYSDEILTIGSGVDFLLYGTNPNLQRKTTAAIFFTKPTKWAHEREWRMFTAKGEPADYGNYKFLPSELESVVIGEHATPETRSAITTIVAERYPGTRLTASQ